MQNCSLAKCERVIQMNEVFDYEIKIKLTFTSKEKVENVAFLVHFLENIHSVLLFYRRRQKVHQHLQRACRAIVLFIQHFL